MTPYAKEAIAIRKSDNAFSQSEATGMDKSDLVAASDTPARWHHAHA
jgi:hypothetical protein